MDEIPSVEPQTNAADPKPVLPTGNVGGRHVPQTASTQSASVAGPSRTLRARPSLPALPTAAASLQSPTATTASARLPTDKEVESIRRRLAPESVEARRHEIVAEKEGELRQLVDQHDTAVREKFHLERYVTMMTGWDPEMAKKDNAPVFLDYKRTYHNLLDLAPQPSHSNAQAGPSRPRASLPSRRTRHQAHEQSEIFAPPPVTPGIVPTVKTEASTNGSVGKSDKGRELDHQASSAKGKQRAVIVETDQDLKSLKARKVLRNSLDMAASDSPAKRGPGRPKGSGVKPAVENQEADDQASPAATGKKRGRPSIQSGGAETSPVKRGPGRPPKPRDLPLATPANDTPEPADTPDEQPVDLAVAARPRSPTPLPSLAHLPFPPPPYRPTVRSHGPRKVWYTDPYQRPPPNPRHQGDISILLASYILLEDTGPPPDLKALEIKAAREAYYFNRVNYLQTQGRLLRLLDENPDNPSSAKAAYKAQVILRKEDHQDHLLAHMKQVRNAMMDEAKNKPVFCRRIAKMIMQYWEKLEGREEREKLELERELKRRAKEIVKAIRKRWALAVKIVRARLIEAQKAEQDRRGKEHLQSMLQRSTGLLEAQQQLGGSEDEENGDSEGDNSGSEGTDDVEPAETDDEDQHLEEQDEGKVHQGDEEDQDAPDISGVETEQAGDADEDKAAEDDDAQDEAEDEDDDEDEEGAQTEARVDLSAMLYPDDTSPPADDQAVQAPEEIDAEVEPDDIHLDDIQRESHLNSEEALLRNDTPNGGIYPSNLPISDPHRLLLPVPGTSMDIDSPDPIDSLSQFDNSRVRTPMKPSAGTSIPNGDHQTTVSPPSQEEAISNNAVSHVADALDSDPSLLDASLPRDNTVTSPEITPVIRSRRARGVAVLLKRVAEADPDANDIEFADTAIDDREDEDERMDAAMEEEDSASGVDSEDEGLLADADVPIEELLKRYGYPAPGVHQDDNADAGVGSEIKAVPLENGISTNDQSLLDDNIGDQTSPLLLWGTKRQRRVRQVWTPEENPPPLKKVKKEDYTPESTPELSEEETEEDEDEEDGEVLEVDEDPNAPKTAIPFLLRGTLRQYQHAGLDWLAALYANNMNGILADEMGLGKTIQTIALLAHLACDRGVWGQHLVIVPTSVILNWEMEFKKFLPGFKILTYYGNQKERKEKRVGWLTEHSWQVCITSYQIVLADQHIFRRKNWVYMILDEAHNIKNFRSQRWQTLLGFKAQRRLLLTGTPLQNNLMELWSLLYFLMPHGIAEEATAVVGFANHKDFMEWFSNPMDKAVESGDILDAEALATVSKLHTLLRPFILRRLKSEVETQLPGKFEHVVYCRLSKRQRFLYDEFMSRASTREALTGGGYMGVMNTLMQLRKVCNHPDLFEVRPVRTSFAMDRSVAADFEPAELLVRKRLFQQADLADYSSLRLDITSNEGISGWTALAREKLEASDQLPFALVPEKKGRQPGPPKLDSRTVEGWLKYRAWADEQASVKRWQALRDVNRLRCRGKPIYGSTLLSILTGLPRRFLPLTATARTKRDLVHDLTPPAAQMIMDLPQRAKAVETLVERFAVIPPNAVARDMPFMALPLLQPDSHPDLLDPEFDTLHHASVKLQIAFPDNSLLQYDCGKLQKLAEMLRDLKADGHRVLIFTQMTRVLDILEMFLSYNGHRYLRLDGSTKIEDRQIITERFNTDSRIFCFIASSRSGGVGINLTGADTVFFYDSDWNPSMDRQCMDRAHRIGQTREVHIYRFVSSHTVEENMLKKANQKRLLDRVVIQDGDFTTEFFGRVDWRETLYDGERPTAVEEREGVEDVEVEDEPEAEVVEETAPRRGEEREFAKMVAEVEDEEDVQAARMALGEGEMDVGDFEAEKAKAQAAAGPAKKVARFADESRGESGTPVTPVGFENEDGVELVEDDDDDVGAVDEFMLRMVEWDWSFFVSYKG